MRQSNQPDPHGLALIAGQMRGAKLRGGCCTPTDMLDAAFGDAPGNGNSETSCTTGSDSSIPVSRTEDRLLVVA
jgi:hypothetical protein